MADWISIKPKNIVVTKKLSSENVLSARYVLQRTDFSKLSVFYIQKTEVSCDDFLSRVGHDGSVRLDQISLRCEAYPDEPVIGLSLKEAELYCELIGAKLPTELQWMAAVLYKESDDYYNEKQRNYFNEELLVDYVVDVEDGIERPSGLKGMIGNVWEMTSTPWGNSQVSYVMKGGAFNLVSKPDLLNPWFRAAYHSQNILNINVGFRCVK